MVSRRCRDACAMLYCVHSCNVISRTRISYSHGLIYMYPKLVAYCVALASRGWTLPKPAAWPSACGLCGFGLPLRSPVHVLWLAALANRVGGSLRRRSLRAPRASYVGRHPSDLRQPGGSRVVDQLPAYVHRQRMPHLGAAEHMRERPTLGSTGRRCATYAHGGGAGWRRGCAC